jgi:hypothetical protein
MKQRLKNKWKKLSHIVLDTLLFVVPILEVSEMIAIIPTEYLPLYMLGTLILRRLVRLLEEVMEKKNVELEANKEQ